MQNLAGRFEADAGAELVYRFSKGDCANEIDREPGSIEYLPAMTRSSDRLKRYARARHGWEGSQLAL